MMPVMARKGGKKSGGGGGRDKASGPALIPRWLFFLLVGLAAVGALALMFWGATRPVSPTVLSP